MFPSCFEINGTCNNVIKLFVVVFFSAKTSFTYELMSIKTSTISLVSRQFEKASLQIYNSCFKKGSFLVQKLFFIISQHLIQHWFSKNVTSKK